MREPCHASAIPLLRPPPTAPADNGRRGTLTVEGVAYPVSLEDLPTRVESFKTLDDTNLVKMTDCARYTARHAPCPGA